MSGRVRLAVALVLCILGVLCAVRYLYWPAVTRPTTVSAALAGNLQELQALQAKGMGLNYHDPIKFEWTPLIAAVYGKNSNVVAYLLSQGVNLEAKDRHGDTALSLAVTGPDSDLAIVKMLVDAGAKTNDTVLSTAALGPQKDRLLQILSRGR